MFGFLLNNQSNTPTFSEVIFHMIKKLVNKETMFCRALHPKTMLLCENLFKVALLLKKKKKFFSNGTRRDRKSFLLPTSHLNHLGSFEKLVHSPSSWRFSFNAPEMRPGKSIFSRFPCDSNIQPQLRTTGVEWKLFLTFSTNSPARRSCHYQAVMNPDIYGAYI